MYGQFTFRTLTRDLESIGRPPSAFVSLRPTCAARSVDFPDLVSTYGRTVTAAADDSASVH